MVTGSDHYKYVFHKYSCVAAPFYNANNELLGTINASYTHTSINEDTLNVIYSLARLYENLVLKMVKSETDERPKDRDEGPGRLTIPSIISWVIRRPLNKQSQWQKGQRW